MSALSAGGIARAVGVFRMLRGWLARPRAGAVARYVAPRVGVLDTGELIVVADGKPSLIFSVEATERIRDALIARELVIDGVPVRQR